MLEGTLRVHASAMSYWGGHRVVIGEQQIHAMHTRELGWYTSVATSRAPWRCSSTFFLVQKLILNKFQEFFHNSFLVILLTDRQTHTDNRWWKHFPPTCCGGNTESVEVWALWVPLTSAERRSIVMSVFVCGSVSQSACISQKSHVQILLNFLYLLPVAVTWSSSENSAICHVLLVLWMTSCSHIMGQLQRKA